MLAAFIDTLALQTNGQKEEISLPLGFKPQATQFLVKMKSRYNMCDNFNVKWLLYWVASTSILNFYISEFYHLQLKYIQCFLPTVALTKM